MSTKVRVVVLSVLLLLALSLIVISKSGSSDTADLESVDLSNAAIANDDLLREMLLGPEDERFVVDSRESRETFMLEALREQSYGSDDRPSLGRDRLAAMSDAEFDDYLDVLLADLREFQLSNSESAEQWLDTYRASWPQQPCPIGGALDASVFDDLLADAIGIASFGDLPGFALTHVADLSLPDGVVHVSRSAFEDAWSVDIEAPGVHPLFVATASLDDWEFAAFAQLVVGPGEPVRWVQEDRLFHAAEYGSLWISGAGAHVATSFNQEDPIESLASQIYNENLIHGEPVGCEHWAHADGRNRLRQDASFDGSFPAYVAYDSANNLVAITWDFREFMVAEESIAGAPQPTPRPTASNHPGPLIDADL